MPSIPVDPRRGSGESLRLDPAISEPVLGDRLPDFLIIGAMKAGTTSLYHYLAGHSGVFMPRTKELDFFTEELSWSRGWNWYRRQFAAAPPGVGAIGEASTSYTKYPRYKRVPERIAGHLPGVRLIYVVRNPIERIRSHFQHNVAIGEEDRPIDEAVTVNPAYIDFSRYAMQVDRYLEFFDRRQLLLLTSENLRDNRLRTTQRVFEFIGVDPDEKIESLGQEFYRTEDRSAYGPVMGGARRALKKRFPSAVKLWRGQFIPPSVKRRLGHRVGSNTEVARISMSPLTIDRVKRELRDDVDALRSYIDDVDFDGWGIA